MATNLPHIPEVERLSKSIIRILGGNPGKFTLQGTNTYLLGTGPSRLLIDTAQGLPNWRASLSKTLTSESCTISDCLITHWHYDHVGGVSDLKSLCPEVKIWKNGVDDEQREKGWGEISEEGGFDGEKRAIWEVEGIKVKAVECPGHTEDHVGFIIESDADGEGTGKGMFAGDNILGHGTAVFENLSLYISSLRKMSTFFNAGGPAYPGHGLVVPDGRAKIEEYIKHRQQREDEVLKVLKTGSLDADVAASAAGESLTPMQLVKVIYWNVPEALHLPAARGVGLILEKLEAEGKVVRVDEGGEELWKVSEGRGKASAL